MKTTIAIAILVLAGCATKDTPVAARYQTNHVALVEKDFKTGRTRMIPQEIVLPIPKKEGD